MSDIPAAGEFICSPWSPKRIIEIKPYTGKYKDWFDCTLVVWADTRKGFAEMAYNSSDWNYDQYQVRRWREENERQAN